MSANATGMGGGEEGGFGGTCNDINVYSLLIYNLAITRTYRGGHIRHDVTIRHPHPYYQLAGDDTANQIHFRFFDFMIVHFPFFFI